MLWSLQTIPLLFPPLINILRDQSSHQADVQRASLSIMSTLIESCWISDLPTERERSRELDSAAKSFAPALIQVATTALRGRNDPFVSILCQSIAGLWSLAAVTKVVWMAFSFLYLRLQTLHCMFALIFNPAYLAWWLCSPSCLPAPPPSPPPSSSSILTCRSSYWPG